MSEESDEVVILFVDDEEKSRKYFSRIFGRNYRVMLAGDGAEAIEIASTNAGRKIGVVVTDQIMPKMNGLDLLQVLSQQNLGMVRVLSTAYTESDLVSGAVTSGLIDYFVSKPWDIPKLQETLDRAAEQFRHNLGKNSAA